MSYLDNENPAVLFGDKILTKTVITVFWIYSCKGNAILLLGITFFE